MSLRQRKKIQKLLRTALIFAIVAPAAEEIGIEEGE